MAFVKQTQQRDPYLLQMGQSLEGHLEIVRVLYILELCMFQNWS